MCYSAATTYFENNLSLVLCNKLRKDINPHHEEEKDMVKMVFGVAFAVTFETDIILPRRTRRRGKKKY